MSDSVRVSNLPIYDAGYGDYCKYIHNDTVCTKSQSLTCDMNSTA